MRGRVVLSHILQLNMLIIVMQMSFSFNWTILEPQYDKYDSVKIKRKMVLNI